MVSRLNVTRLLGFVLTFVVFDWLNVRWFREDDNSYSRRTTRTLRNNPDFDVAPSSSRTPLMNSVDQSQKILEMATLSSSSPVGCTTGIPCDRYDDIVDFRIIVITYSRTKSLMRLLATLDDLVLDGHKAALEIWIDVDKNGSANGDTLAAARSFKWKKGVTRVHLQSRNAGIMGQWIDTWRPRSDSHEIGLILEDDLIVSPMAFRWLKHVHREMKTQNRTDYAGATIQSETNLLSPKNTGPIVGPRSDTIVMYKGFGSWGFSPNPEHWRHFQDWFHSHKPSVMPNFHPYVNVPECLLTQWYIIFEKKGNAHNMWTIWFAYYMHFEQLFCVYNNLDVFTGKRDTCLSINMKEPGLHYKRSVSNARPSCSLLKHWKEQFVQFPKSITRLHWDGTPIRGEGYFL